jgi:hypothetical protein
MVANNSKMILPIKWKEKLIDMLIPYGHSNLDSRFKRCPPQTLLSYLNVRFFFSENEKTTK